MQERRSIKWKRGGEEDDGGRRGKKRRGVRSVLPVYDFAGNAFPGVPVLLSFIPVPIDVLFRPLSARRVVSVA